MAAIIAVSLVISAALTGEDAFVAGRDAALLGQHEAALKTFQGIAEGNGPLAPYAAVRAAEARAHMGDLTGAIAALRDLLERQPEGPWVLLARERLGRFLERAGATDESARERVALLDMQPLPWCLSTYAWEAARNGLQSIETRPRALAYFRGQALTSSLGQARLDAAAFLVTSPEPADLLAAGRAYVRAGDLPMGARVLASVPADALGEDGLRDQFREVAGWLRVGTGEDEAGLQALNAFIEEQGDSAWARAAVLTVARRLVDRGKLVEAEAVAARMAEAFPGAEETGDAYWRLGQGYASADAPQAAAAAYDRLAAICPTHFRANEGLFTGAMYYYLAQSNTSEARKRFERVVEHNPDGRHAAAAIYWLGCLEEQAGARDQATAHYRKALEHTLGDYYAHRALARLHALDVAPEDSGKAICADGETWFLWGFAAPPAAPLAVTLDEPLAAALERLTFLALHGCEEAEWEAVYLLNQQHPAEVMPRLYETMAGAGLAHTALEHAKAHPIPGDEALNTALMQRLAFPRAYWPLVEQVSAETGVDPYLMLAVGLQESTFRASISSWAGARGVMQVMPKTAEWLAKVEPALGSDVVYQLEVPSQSLRMGGYYLMRMIERSGGNLVYALASYNAGPGNLSKWRKRYPDADLDYFVEAIPFSETRTYVKRVLGAYAAYRSLYGAASPDQSTSIASP